MKFTSQSPRLITQSFLNRAKLDWTLRDTTYYGVWVCSTFFREIVDALRNFFLFNPSFLPSSNSWVLAAVFQIWIRLKYHQPGCLPQLVFENRLPCIVPTRFETFLDVKVWNDQAANRTILAHPQLCTSKKFLVTNHSRLKENRST